MFTVIITAILSIMLLILIWLLLICPADVEDRDEERFASRFYAHRGFHDEEKPENSMPAFHAAAEADWGIEMDVRLTKDKKVVIFHDDTLERICSDPRRVDELTYDELQTIQLSGTNEHVPLLTDVLNEVDGRVPLIVEFKPAENWKEVCGMAAAILDEYAGDWCMESFDPRMVRWFRKEYPKVFRGQLSCSMRGLKPACEAFLLENLLMNFYSRPHFVAYCHEHMNKIAFRACRRLRCLPVAWTVRSQKDMDRLLDDEILTQIFENFTPSEESRKRLFEPENKGE